MNKGEQSRPNIVTDEVIAHFNAFADNIRGKEMSCKEMKSQIETKLGWKCQSYVLSALSSGVNPPIIKIKRGICVINPKPIYKERLQTALDKAKKACACYNKNSRSNLSKEEQIQSAINLLKQNGYRVYKSIVKYEEV